MAKAPSDLGYKSFRKGFGEHPFPKGWPQHHHSERSYTRLGMPTSGFHYVYVLASEADPARHYTGCTSDLPARLKTHNAGGWSLLGGDTARPASA